MAAAVVIMISAVTQVANSQVIGGLKPLPPGGGASHAYGDQVTVQVNRNFYGFSSLDLDSYLGSRIQGRTIESITVRMASESGRAQATLLIEGVPSDRPKVISSYLTEYDFSVNGRQRNSGYRQNIELRFNGQVFVQQVTAHLAPEYQPRPPRSPRGPQLVTEYLYRTFDGDNTLYLDNLLRLNRYYGQRINRVILRARAERGNGRAALWINGAQDGAPLVVGSYTQEYNFFPINGRVIGRDAHDLAIFLRGRFVVESVSVELAQ